MLVGTARALVRRGRSTREGREGNILLADTKPCSRLKGRRLDAECRGTAGPGGYEKLCMI
jgi:hypothetical protein